MSRVKNLIVPAASPAEEPLVAAQTRLAELYEKLARKAKDSIRLDDIYADIELAESEVSKEKERFAQVLESQPPDELDLALQEAVDLLDGKITVDQAKHLTRRANKSPYR